MLEIAQEFLTTATAQWSTWIAPMAWQLGLLVVVLWCLEVLLARRSARLRYLMWSLVLVRLVLPPTFSAPTGILWWVGDRPQKVYDQWVKSPSEIAKNTQPKAEVVLEQTLNIPTSGYEVATQTAGKLPLAEVLFLLWCGVVLTRLAFLGLAARRVRQWRCSAEPLIDPQVLAILAAAKHKVGVSKRIELRDSHACTTPLVTGMLHPAILLPSHLVDTFNERELQAVLVHELMHVRRYDSWIRWFQAILSILYFFHPAVWVANWYLCRAREDACDELTIAALGGQRKPYAAAIVKAATTVGYQPPHLAIGMLHSSHSITRRIERILDPSLPIEPGNMLARSGLCLVVAATLLPAGDPLPDARSPPPLITQAPTRLEPALQEPAPEEPAAQEPTTSVSTTSASKTVPSLNLEEQQALELLKSVDIDDRRSAYDRLRTVGHRDSLDVLEKAYLERTGLEQDWVKQALDAVWLRVRRDAPYVESTVRSSRILEPPAED